MKINDKDKTCCFAFVMQNRVAFRDKFMPIATGRYYKTRFYQYPAAICDDIVMFGGRSIGKSYDLEGTIIQTMVNKPSEESLLTAFRKTHIKDREENVITYMQQIPYFRAFFRGANRTARDSISRTPIYCIKLRNGHTHFGISIGDDPAAIMIQGHHPQYRFGEEFQAYPDSAWVKWQNTQDPRGSIDRYYGTVDGRLETPFRKLDTVVDKFKHTRFHVPRVLEPHFNQRIKRTLIESLGGETTNEYLQQVLANWGEPVWGVWDQQAISDCLDKKEDPKFPGLFINKVTTIELTAKSYRGLTPRDVLQDLPPLPKDDLDVILGIDAGYTSPTMILPFFFYEGKWNLRCRIALKDKMIPDDQAEIIDYVSDQYGAGVICIDCSSSEGKAPATILTNPKTEKYKNKKYEERIHWCEFQKNMTMGFTADGTEITDKVKGGTTTILRQMFARNEFRIYNDEELLEEFNREAKKRVKDGETILTPENVHIPDAFRCFAFGFFITHGGAEKPKRNANADLEFPFFENVVPLFGRGSTH